MRTVIVAVTMVLAVVMAAEGAAGAAPVVERAASAAVVSQQADHAEQVPTLHPTWYRSCGWANCSVYFNKHETRIAAYGGSLLSSLICTMLRTTAAALFCTAISWAVGKAGDNAVSAGRCVKISFSRWTGLVYYIGTYSSWRCA